MEHDDAMPEQSSMAKGRAPQGMGDDPFGLIDLHTMDQPKWGQLEGNPPNKFVGERKTTKNFSSSFIQFLF